MNVQDIEKSPCVMKSLRFAFVDDDQWLAFSCFGKEQSVVGALISIMGSFFQ